MSEHPIRAKVEFPRAISVTTTHKEIKAAPRARVGVIGGTGLGDVLMQEAGGESAYFDTPFGPPSTPPILSNWEGVDVAFISRHGVGHRFNPTNVPYRANIWVMKELGVSAIIASGATGSLREEIEPGHLVVCDQVIDRTIRRANTFFDEGIVAHVELAEPFCPFLRRLLLEASNDVGSKVHDRGTYVCMEGPQFSTRAESQLHRAWGADLIGMTCMPEAKLAREAEICYALIGLPTDYDCWRPAESDRPPDDLLRTILGNLRSATDGAIALLRAALRRFEGAQAACHCGDALKLAIWSDKTRVDPYVRKRLSALIGRYFSDVQ